MGNVFGAINVINTSSRDIVAKLYQGTSKIDELTISAGQVDYFTVDLGVVYVVKVNGLQVGPSITLKDCGGNVSCISNQATIQY